MSTSSPPKASKKGGEKKPPVFPVGTAAQRVLKKALRNAKGVEVIKAFQQANSLHSMVAAAFDTQPRYQAAATTRSKGREAVESLDTDSVLEFLSHLGVSHQKVNQRISDTLLKQLEDEIRKTTDDKPLLDLLSDVWGYAVKFKQVQLRPIIWTILRKLGDKTPPAVLQALAERDTEGNLRNEALYNPLPPLLQKLVWEADWTERISHDIDMEPTAYLERVSETILFQTMNPCVTQYCTNKVLVQTANQPFVSNTRDRRILTTQRRALTAASAAASTTGATSLIRGKPSSSRKSDQPSSGKAIAEIRDFLTDSSGNKSIYRPRLLYALLSILMAQHGIKRETFMGGADFLQCTLISDILLSSGGPLPPAYQQVQTLARNLDECVEKGDISDDAIIRIQKLIRQIFQPDLTTDEAETTAKRNVQETVKDNLSNATKRQLNRIVTESITVMKQADPQSLFLNPVTDTIAPNYSKVIKKPMCISMMEEKVANSAYNSVEDWQHDVKLMFNNCINYNRGPSGKWFRDEAQRQIKVFNDEIFPQARKLFKDELVKKQHELVSNRKRPVDDAPDLKPLPPSVKKRKKDKDDMAPSMPALASMLMADPFFVRTVLARVLKELRQGVRAGNALPLAHRAIPSLLQFLHLSRFSTQVCATQGKRFVVPDGGMEPVDQPDDVLHYVPYATLRNDLPLLLRLLIEAEVDSKVVVGEEWYDADRSTSLKPPPIDHSLWVISDQMEVSISLVEGALVHICQPGNTSEASLATTFEKFAVALRLASVTLQHHRVFFQSLIVGILRHKAKLTKTTRDKIVECWLDWLRSFKQGRSTSAAHECFILLLNEWSSLGNLILPRDTMLEFTKKAVDAVNDGETSDEKKFHNLWQSDDAEFEPVKKQYMRMLKMLPETNAKEWKGDVGLSTEDETPADAAATVNQDVGVKDASEERGLSG